LQQHAAKLAAAENAQAKILIERFHAETEPRKESGASYHRALAF
jgi:hypothetical protein